MSHLARVLNSQLTDWVYSKKSAIHGTGLFAKKAIKKGEYIGTYWGPEAKRNGMYVLWVYEGETEESAVGRSGRNLLRFLNHSVPGNCEFEQFDLYARRNIKKDEELTFDYHESEFD